MSYNNNLLKTDKQSVEAFYQELRENLPVEIEWTKGQIESSRERANSATITLHGRNIFRFYGKDAAFRAELAGDDVPVIIQAARDTRLAHDPQTGLIDIQIMSYLILFGLVLIFRPDAALLIGVGVSIGLAGFAFYSMGVIRGCSRSMRLILTIFLFICLLPTAPASILLVYAAGSLNRKSFHSRLYDRKVPVALV